MSDEEKVTDEQAEAALQQLATGVSEEEVEPQEVQAGPEPSVDESGAPVAAPAEEGEPAAVPEARCSVDAGTVGTHAMRRSAKNTKPPTNAINAPHANPALRLNASVSARSSRSDKQSSGNGSPTVNLP